MKTDYRNSLSNCKLLTPNKWIQLLIRTLQSRFAVHLELELPVDCLCVPWQDDLPAVAAQDGVEEGLHLVLGEDPVPFAVHVPSGLQVPLECSAGTDTDFPACIHALWNVCKSSSRDKVLQCTNRSRETACSYSNPQYKHKKELRKILECNGLQWDPWITPATRSVLSIWIYWLAVRSHMQWRVNCISWRVVTPTWRNYALSKAKVTSQHCNYPHSVCTHPNTNK